MLVLHIGPPQVMLLLLTDVAEASADQFEYQDGMAARRLMHLKLQI